MGDTVINKINIVCNDDMISQSLLKEAFCNLCFADKPAEKVPKDLASEPNNKLVFDFEYNMQEISKEIVLKIIGRDKIVYEDCDLNVLVLNLEKCTSEGYLSSCRSYDIVLFTGNISEDALQESSAEEFTHMLIPDLNDCINFIKFIYLSFNSYHAISYDAYLDIFYEGNKIIQSYYTENYDKLVNYIEEYEKSHNQKHSLILCSKEYDYGNGLRFAHNISKLMEVYKDNNFNVIITENYNLEEKNNYYLAFIKE